MLLEHASSHVADFAEAARGYCAWCEAAPSEHAHFEAAYWLARLYALALMLPKVVPESDADLPPIPAEALAKAVANLAPFSGCYYRNISDPHPDRSEEPGMGDIGDDLLDTYKDIRCGMVLFDSGEVTEAVWHWSFLHQVHWGRHAVGALNALHCLVISGSLRQPFARPFCSCHGDAPATLVTPLSPAERTPPRPRPAAPPAHSPSPG